jgi:hypothetical protein
MGVEISVSTLIYTRWMPLRVHCLILLYKEIPKWLQI